VRIRWKSRTSSVRRRFVIVIRRSRRHRNRTTPSWQSKSVIPTIYLVGIDDLERIPEFLDLGLIVVVSPDPASLRRWQHEQELGEAPMDRPAATTGVVVEMDARRISYRDVPLPLSDREFHVMAGLGLVGAGEAIRAR